MPKLKVVFRGTYDFHFNIPEAAPSGSVVEALAWMNPKAVWCLDDLELLQCKKARDFLHAQAVCIPKVEIGLDEYYSNFVPIPSGAVRWVLCFPVIRRKSGLYVPRTRTVPAYGDDVFYTLTSLASKTPIRAVWSVNDLEFFEFLFPRQRQPDDKLVVIRAKDCETNKRGYVVYIRPQDIIEQETISDSGMRINPCRSLLDSPLAASTRAERRRRAPSPGVVKKSRNFFA